MAEDVADTFYTAPYRFPCRAHDHRDRFDLWKWSAQALGLPGRLLGW